MIIKKKIQNYIDECNEMNDHIEDLKNTYAEFKQTDYGTATNIDYSNYNYQRRELKKFLITLSLILLLMTTSPLYFVLMI